MRIAIRLVLATGCAVMLTAASWPTQLPAPAAAPKRVYTLVDQRNAKSFKSGFESLLVTNCAYGSMRVGDNDIDPHLVTFLDAMLGERFGDKLAGKAIILHGFSVNLNGSANLRQISDNVLCGSSPCVIPHLMNNKDKIACAPEDMVGGYTLGEVSPIGPPLIAAVKVEIDGKIYYGRGITEWRESFPPKRKDSDFIKMVWNNAVAKVVDDALTQLGNKLGQDMFGETPVENPSDSVLPVEPAIPDR
jgi:hypothetical protein